MRDVDALLVVAHVGVAHHLNNVCNGLDVIKDHKSHSFFFRNYVYAGGTKNIIGMKVIDAAFHCDNVVKRGS